MIIEYGRLSEEYKCGARNKAGVHPLHALEKHHLHLTGFIGHNSAETGYKIVLEFVRRQFSTVFGVKTHLGNRGADLDLGKIRVDIGNTDYAAAVYVAERIQAHEVPDGSYSQLLLEKFRPFGPDAREVLYGCIQIHQPQR